MEVDKQLKFKSNPRMQVEFISNNVDVMTHDCLSSVALAALFESTVGGVHCEASTERVSSHDYIVRFKELTLSSFPSELIEDVCEF